MNNKTITVATLFSGAGGLDLGFKLAGFNLIWSNEFDKNIWATHEENFPECYLDKRSITQIEPNDIPDVDGFIGGLHAKVGRKLVLEGE